MTSYSPPLSIDKWKLQTYEKAIHSLLKHLEQVPGQLKAQKLWFELHGEKDAFAKGVLGTLVRMGLIKKLGYGKGYKLEKLGLDFLDQPSQQTLSEAFLHDECISLFYDSLPGLGITTEHALELWNALFHARREPPYVRGILSWMMGLGLLVKDGATKKGAKWRKPRPDEQGTTNGRVLPPQMFDSTAVTNLCREINASYEGKQFTACAVLMRRLAEVLLILAYRARGLEDRIREPNGVDYRQLGSIIGDAKSAAGLGLGKKAEVLNDIQKLGNLSAHELYWTCPESQIAGVIIPYQVVVADLLVQAGFVSGRSK